MAKVANPKCVPFCTCDDLKGYKGLKHNKVTSLYLIISTEYMPVFKHVEFILEFQVGGCESIILLLFVL